MEILLKHKLLHLLPLLKMLTSFQEFHISVNEHLFKLAHESMTPDDPMLTRNYKPHESSQTSLLTLKEPNIPWLVFKGGIDVVRNPPPVTGR